MHLQASGIDHIEPHAIVADDGTRTEIDTLVLATGFDLWEANIPAIEIIGRDGRNLGKWWRENRFQAYQGVSVPYFPNYLSLASPYAFIGLNFFNTMEYQMRIMDRLLGGGEAPRRAHLRGHRRGQRTLPRPDDRAGRRHGVHRRALRRRAVLLLQPARRGDAAAADDGQGRHPGGVRISR